MGGGGRTTANGTTATLVTSVDNDYSPPVSWGYGPRDEPAKWEAPSRGTRGTDHRGPFLPLWCPPTRVLLGFRYEKRGTENRKDPILVCWTGVRTSPGVFRDPCTRRFLYSSPSTLKSSPRDPTYRGYALGPTPSQGLSPPARVFPFRRLGPRRRTEGPRTHTHVRRVCVHPPYSGSRRPGSRRELRPLTPGRGPAPDVAVGTEVLVDVGLRGRGRTRSSQTDVGTGAHPSTGSSPGTQSSFRSPWFG